MNAFVRALPLAILLATAISTPALAQSKPVAVSLALDTQARVADEVAPLVDREIESFRRELLSLAFESVSRMPTVPHVKNRSRAQEELARAALELDQPRLAEAFAERITNWQRGSALAECAHYAANHAANVEARTLLERSTSIVKQALAAEEQVWRLDRIRARIAGTYLALGDEKAAEASALGLTESEAGALLSARSRLVRSADLAAHEKALDDMIRVGGLEQLEGALRAYVELYRRAGQDEQSRARFEAKVRGAWAKLPPQVRIEICGELVLGALDHRDATKATEFLDVARAMLRASTWLAQDRIPIAARLAELAARAGQAAEAERELAECRSEFDAQRERIVDIHRADVLRAIASAEARCGRMELARAGFARAAEEGVANPNSRPRAEDLAETCRALALAGVEPDAALWSRLRAIAAALGEPW